MSQLIAEVAQHIGNRLEEDCKDEQIITVQEGATNSVDWDRFLADLCPDGRDDETKCAILEHPIERTVYVKKDSSTADHRTYTIHDTILLKALRRSPPEYVLHELAMISPSYRISKEIYNLILPMTMADDEWTDIKRILYRLNVSKSYGLTDPQIKNVFRIRHGWREDTLLMISSRRDPPLKIVQELLKACRDSIAIVDTALYDWIPMIYAIAYGAKSEVTEAMIPTKDDFQSLKALQEFNFLECVDVYNRTPLHWTVFYDATLETVNALKDLSPSHALDMRDNLNKRPFELAISEGTSMEIVEALLPGSIPDFETVEMNIVRSCIYKKVRSSNTVAGPALGNEFKDHPSLGTGISQDEEDEFADMLRYDVSSKSIPYLAKQLAMKPNLQKILIAKSCQTVPTVVLMLDFYACILLILSFRECSTFYLEIEATPSSAPIWLYVLALTVGYMSMREICQMYAGGLIWITSFWNYLDLSIIVVVAWCGLKMRVNDTGSYFPTLVVYATALIWMNALVFLRSTFLRFAIFVNGLMTIVGDLIPFLIVTLIMLLAFGEMYMVDSLANGTCANSEEGGLSFCTFGGALFSTYALFVGGIAIEEFASTTTMRIISIAFGFFVAVILLNVVIAIVSSSWESVSEKGKEVVSENPNTKLISALLSIFDSNKPGPTCNSVLGVSPFVLCRCEELRRNVALPRWRGDPMG